MKSKVKREEKRETEKERVKGVEGMYKDMSISSPFHSFILYKYMFTSSSHVSYCCV